MTPRLKFASGVRAEITEAARWYAERDREVGGRFVSAADRAIRRALQWPDAGSPVEEVKSPYTIRRVPVGRFPYQVVYARVDDAVYVLAVAHHHRQPGYWSGRTPAWRDSVR